jgi:hypothetical protein
VSLTDEERNWFATKLAKLATEQAKDSANIERVETSLLTDFHE